MAQLDAGRGTADCSTNLVWCLKINLKSGSGHPSPDFKLPGWQSWDRIETGYYDGAGFNADSNKHLENCRFCVSVEVGAGSVLCLRTLIVAFSVQQPDDFIIVIFILKNITLRFMIRLVQLYMFFLLYLFFISFSRTRYSSPSVYVYIMWEHQSSLKCIII